MGLRNPASECYQQSIDISDLRSREIDPECRIASPPVRTRMPGFILALFTAVAFIGLVPEPGFAASKHEISAVAPGRAVPGQSIRVYGRTFTPGQKVWIVVSNQSSVRGAVFEIEIEAKPDRSVEFQLPVDLQRGMHWLAARRCKGGRTSPWVPALEIVAPTWTLPPDDPPTRQEGAIAQARPLVPGQVVLGSWSGPGDADFFLLATGAGGVFDLTLERTDTSLSVFNPKSANPELLVADPDGIICGKTACYSDDISANDTDARIRGYVALKSGVHLVVCRTSHGSGGYRLSVNRVGHVAGDEFTSIAYGFSALGIIGRNRRPHVVRRLVFDPRGIPAAGVRLDWAVDGGRVVRGSDAPSRTNGVTWVAIQIGRQGSATITADHPWPWNDPEASKAGEIRRRGGGTIIARANFYETGEVFSLKTTNQRSRGMRMNSPSSVGGPQRRSVPEGRY